MVSTEASPNGTACVLCWKSRVGQILHLNVPPQRVNEVEPVWLACCVSTVFTKGGRHSQLASNQRDRILQEPRPSGGEQPKRARLRG